MRNSKSYNILPYNPNLKKRARELRKSGNLSEVLVWKQLNKQKFKGYDFDRQKVIGNYIVDFFCLDCFVVIEIDGNSHDDRTEYDQERDEYLRGLGLTVIRVKAFDVLNCLNEVMMMLINHPALRAPLHRGEFAKDKNIQAKGQRV